MDLGEIVALIVVGALAGTAAASLMGWNKPSKGSSNWLRNTVIGIAGAVVGGFLFRALNISLPEILSATISAADVIVAFVGALVVIFVVGLIRK